MNRLLRPVRDEPRPPDVPPLRWTDWALVAAIVVIAVVEGLVRADYEMRTLSVGVAAGLAPTLLWRRRRPLLALMVAFGVGTVVDLVAGAEVTAHTLIYLLLLPFSLVRWGSGREIVAGAAIVPARIGLSLAMGHSTLGDAVGGLAVVSAACAVGAALRYRSRARTRELDQVRLLERERLARELHDTVAHHVSAMAIRAQAGLATAEVNPEAAADALRLIESEASRTLAEMRAMVRVLRDAGPADLEPRPGVRDLARLAGPSRSGPLVDVRIDADLDDLDDLPLPVGTAIYRLAQESITNARRHARNATRIDVRVAADDTTVSLLVSDDGEPGPPDGSPGYGMIGMIERADLLGGTVEAGPNPGRGWTVRAVLPRTGG
ncbi:signal transduction histidine kinase [Prauserella shujinwangii]|uniref:histidine kinase n=1 Tax=Prauserella shujinwangii TaxID=1453103 RepID=A0A2T0LKY8_9PSEU|nr:sensor histidine kinase [Prauserella shujinwangii]PRX43619.1 signal transduction histidine kinase [Prauserella shujinwangii]